MITSFKIFENNEIGISFIPNDLISYFENKVELYLLPFIDQEIKEFFNKFLLQSNIKFSCKVCKKRDMDGTEHILHYNKEHKGKVSGYDYIKNKKDSISLSINLYRIRNSHEVDTSKPVTIFGEIPEGVKKTIKDLELYLNIYKYNL